MILNLGEWPRRTKITYSGTCTTKAITVDNTTYVLYTITGSGILTIKGKEKTGVGIWLCGGGDTTATQSGGGGGYFAQSTDYVLEDGTYTVTVGAAEGTTTFIKDGVTLLTANGSTNINGGSGGGGPGYTDDAGGWPGGTGTGQSTRPFDDSTNFTSLPCAGGGGGSEEAFSGNSSGGKGGSNGSNGFSSTNSGGSSVTTAAGGATGGGPGRTSSSSGSGNASYYGSGGGGRYVASGSSSLKGSNGTGYQGVLFIRIPATTFTWTGNPAICQSPAGTILNISTMSWIPYQTGSDDPSPSNIRPIAIMDEIVVKRLEDNTTKTWTLSQSVVGGEINSAGVGTETWKIVTLDGTSIYFVAGTTENGKTYYNVSGFSLVNSTGNNAANYISSHFPPNTFNGNSSGRKLYTSSTAIGPYFSSVSELNNYLTQQYNAGTPVQVAYKLATANSFTTTGGGSFTAIRGTNTLSSDGITLTVFGIKI